MVAMGGLFCRPDTLMAPAYLLMAGLNILLNKCTILTVTGYESSVLQIELLAGDFMIATTP